MQKFQRNDFYNALWFLFVLPTSNIHAWWFYLNLLFVKDGTILFLYQTSYNER